MDGMLVVIFDTEAKAIEGASALVDLDDRGSVSLYAHAILAKNADGTTRTKRMDDFGPFNTLAGLELGSFIGLFGGPSALPIAAGIGLLGGGAVDIHNARLDQEFVRDVSKQLQPNRFALVARVQENWPDSVDMRMKAIGGSVFRRDLSDVKRMLTDEHKAAAQADIAHMKAELTHADASRKAKLQERINRLESWLEKPVHNWIEPPEPEERTEKSNAETPKAKMPTLNQKAG
jgi:uncharacterized membrane protein